MCDSGYKQAIENYAFEIDAMSCAIDAIPLSLTEKMMSIVSKSGPVFEELKEKSIILDNILPVIATTYHRSEEEVERDVSRLLDEKIKHYIGERKKT